MPRLLCLLPLLVACGESAPATDLPDAAVTSPDAVPVTVLSVSPADGAIDVEPTTVIEVVFSQPVEGASITVTSAGATEAGDLTVEGATVRFTPRRRLAVLGSYQVEVGPIAQTVTFRVRDGVFGEAEPLLGFDANGKDLVALEADAQGEGAVAVSSARITGGGYPDELWATRISGGVLSEAEPIETTVDDDIEDVDVAIGPDLMVVWTREAGGVSEVVAVRSTAPGVWETPVPLAADAYQGRVSSDAQGGMLAVWKQGADLVGRHLDPAIGWGEVEPVEALSGDIDDLSLENGVLAWTYLENPSQLDVWINRYDSAGWGEAAQLDPADADNANRPVVSGGFVIWGDNNEVWVRRNVPGSGWEPAAPIADHDDAGPPKIASDASGRAVAVWHRAGTADHVDIWSSTFSPGSGWSEPVILDSEDLGAAHEPLVVLDQNGNGAAVWRQKDGSGEGIWANRYRQDGGWQGAARLADDPSGLAIFRAAVDGRGQVYVAWEDGAGQPMIRVLQ